MAYEVRTPVFEGPFDLLLHLILRSEVELFELSLSAIVDEYLVEIERMETLDLDVATEFLLIAATLVELKARRLLPDVGGSDIDEELLRFEARDLLLARLLEYKTFKDAAEALQVLITRADRSLPRVVGPEEPYRSLVPDPLDRITTRQIAAAARRAFAPRSAPQVDTDHVAPVRASVADAIVVVLDRLPIGTSVSFRSLVTGAADRVEAVVRFLTVLELFKQGMVDLDQTETFGELRVLRLAVARALDVDSIADWDHDVEDAAEAVAADEVFAGPGSRPRTGDRDRDEYESALDARIDAELDAALEAVRHSDEETV
ncbi:MAG: segregation and condensation protein A [Actinomycetota bacterium]